MVKIDSNYKFTILTSASIFLHLLGGITHMNGFLQPGQKFEHKLKIAILQLLSFFPQ